MPEYRIPPVPDGLSRQLTHWLREVRDATKSTADIADLNQTVAGPTTAEVQAISDKLDELLQALRDLGVLK